MNLRPPSDVLFYPFHLCHERTLHQLLLLFSRVHFRDYMAIQLSPLCGTTAYPDRMGDTFPELLSSGRLVQGYHVSGPLSGDTASAVDRDLSDPLWRAEFHRALAHDQRFQRGLFGVTSDDPSVPRLSDDRWRTRTLTVAALRELSRSRLTDASADWFDYGMALLKTSAALVYTVQIATEHHLAVATDSPAHFALLAHITKRDGVRVDNTLIARTGY
jgi:hypothetical protein